MADLYHKLNDEQKERLMALVSHNVSELRNIPWPDELKDILEKRSILEKYVQLSLTDDSDIVVED